jgi:type I restriction enzyme S subunit
MGPHEVRLEVLKLQVPIPPLTEQQRIIARSDYLQTKVHGLKCLQTESATQLDALLPSVLDKAFRGELQAAQAGYC